MQTETILAMLIAERDKLSRAIEALQGTESPETIAAAKKAKQSERMKGYWAARRKAKK